jgi:hypothetical protein
LNFKTYFVIFDCALLFSLVALQQNCFDPYLFWLIKSNTTDDACGTGTAHPSGAHEFTTVFSGFRVARFVDYWLSFLYFFFWPLYCLSFDLRLLIISFGIFKLFSILILKPIVVLHFQIICNIMSRVWVLGVSNLPLSTILIFDFVILPTVWYLFVHCIATILLS